jgi:branched-chain amino acid aminotransferase
MNYCFLNGEILPLSVARISPMDIGFLRGYAIFEVMRISNGKIFNFNGHMDRMFASAEKMKLKIPHTREEIKEIVESLIEKNKEGSYVRVVLTGGEVVKGMSYNPEKPTFLVTVEVLGKMSDDYYKNGVKLSTVEHERPLFSVKTTNYAVAVREIPEAQKQGSIDILYTSKGKVLEGSTSSFFVVKKGVVVTPKEGVLPGTTRKLVLEIAKENFETEEREILIDELKEVDEAFITAVNKKILPVTKIDNLTIGDGKVGKVTSSLINTFKERED